MALSLLSHTHSGPRDGLSEELRLQVLGNQDLAHLIASFLGDEDRYSFWKALSRDFPWVVTSEVTRLPTESLFDPKCEECGVRPRKVKLECDTHICGLCNKMYDLWWTHYLNSPKTRFSYMIYQTHQVWGVLGSQKALYELFNTRDFYLDLFSCLRVGEMKRYKPRHYEKLEIQRNYEAEGVFLSETPLPDRQKERARQAHLRLLENPKVHIPSDLEGQKLVDLPYDVINELIFLECRKPLIGGIVYEFYYDLQATLHFSPESTNPLFYAPTERDVTLTLEEIRGIIRQFAPVIPRMDPPTLYPFAINVHKLGATITIFDECCKSPTPYPEGEYISVVTKHDTRRIIRIPYSVFEQLETLDIISLEYTRIEMQYT